MSTETFFGKPPGGHPESWPESRQCIAFEGHRCLAAGSLLAVAQGIRKHLEGGKVPAEPLLVFDRVTSEIIEIDFPDVLDALEHRPGEHAASGNTGSLQEGQGSQEDKKGQQGKGQGSGGRGRPKLGVTGKEVTLLPRHWDWLATQPGGISPTLRRLVERARKQSREGDQIREKQTALYRFLHAIGGDLPGFEEVSRSLFAGDEAGFQDRIAHWPPDIRSHALALGAGAFMPSPVSPVPGQGMAQ